MRILAESCLRDVKGERMALETASNLLLLDEGPLPLLPSAGCRWSGALWWSRRLSLWW